jgi:GNAT superfamily N-acetyltransferase
MTLEHDSVDQPPLPIRPAIDGSDVRRLTPAEVPRTARALASAFADDPVMSWVYPVETGREERLVRAFELYLRRVWLPEDECFIPERLFGAALWMPPGAWHLSQMQQLRLLPAMIATTGRSFGRMMIVLRALEKAHPGSPSHYYLAVLGIEPEWQGRGFGSALMKPVLDRCDSEGIPAYLESSKRRNVVLYERHGFKVVEELTLPRGGPPIWRMWREPSG